MKRVLLAEDNPVNQRVMLAFIKKLGYTVSLANDGNEALQKFESEGADIILMDCNMPDLDGLEATRRIRRMEEERGLTPTPIVAVTAHASGSSAAQCRAAGMNDHIAKPIMFEGLRTVMAKWCAQ
jgi:two-component system sensor histidine kinase/response regulator